MPLLVMASGAAGGVVHALGSLTFHVAQRDFGAEWVWWHLAHAYRSALLGLIVYVLLLGGVSLLTGGEGNVQPHLLLAFASFAGLFTHSTLEWLGYEFEEARKKRGIEKKPAKESTPPRPVPVEDVARTRKAMAEGAASVANALKKRR